MDNHDQQFMAEALAMAEMANRAGEVPVGAVLVADGRIIGRGYNSPISRCDPTAHAEIIALRDGGRRMANYRLPETTLYVTIEPCAMCFGASVHARVQRIVFGANEPKSGVVSTQSDWLNSAWCNHHIIIEGGQNATEAGLLIQQFFARRRTERQARKAILRSLK